MMMFNNVPEDLTRLVIDCKQRSEAGENTIDVAANEWQPRMSSSCIKTFLEAPMDNREAVTAVGWKIVIDFKVAVEEVAFDELTNKAKMLFAQEILRMATRHLHDVPDRELDRRPDAPFGKLYWLRSKLHYIREDRMRMRSFWERGGKFVPPPHLIERQESEWEQNITSTELEIKLLEESCSSKERAP